MDLEYLGRIVSACRHRIRRVLGAAPIFLAAGVGVAIWMVFRPGFLDADGLNQLHQAANNYYTDWFSPLLTLGMKATIKAGCTLSGATLIQSVFAAVAVYSMAAQVLMFLTRHRRPEWQIRWSALAVLAALLTPFTPLMYFFVHFRNDSLAAFFLAGAVAGWLRAEWVWNGDPRGSNPVRKLLVLIPPAGLTILAIMVRYNALVILPVIALLVAVIIGRTSRILATVTAAVLILAPMILHQALLRLLDVRRSQPERQIMAIELVGMCVENAELRSKLPYTSSRLRADRFPAKYVPGCVLSVLPGAPEEFKIVQPDYGTDYPRLEREFRWAIRKYPGTWLTVKAKAAAASLFDLYPHPYHPVIDPNPYGLAFRDELRGIRTLVWDIQSTMFQEPFLRFLCNHHLPWLVLNIMLVTLAALAAAMARTRRSVVLVSILLLPLAYYVSHLLAVAAHDYRYMFPATLLVQVFLASGAVVIAGRWVQAHVERSLQDEDRSRILAEPEGGTSISLAARIPHLPARLPVNTIAHGRDR